MNIKEQEVFKNIVIDICDVLNIDSPKIIHNSDFPKNLSKTTKACYDPQENIIYLTSDIILLDAVFNISHELRHVWQKEYYYEKYFSNYKNRVKFEDINL